jgi:hypothetical protein
VLMDAIVMKITNLPSFLSSINFLSCLLSHFLPSSIGFVKRLICLHLFLYMQAYLANELNRNCPVITANAVLLFKHWLCNCSRELLY